MLRTLRVFYASRPEIQVRGVRPRAPRLDTLRVFMLRTLRTLRVFNASPPIGAVFGSPPNGWVYSSPL
jgi:hypothetical protein